jgi:NitT/TauT family transport system substrate-binding protein
MSTKHKLLSGILIITFLILLFIFLKPKEDNQQEIKNTLTEVNVAQFGEVFLYMPLYLANEGGFFEKEGLKVHITNTGGDDKTFAAVIGGSADFGIADPTFVAIAKEKGQGGKVIASIVNGVPFWGITKNKDIPIITEGKMLNGYSVATFPSPSTAYTLQLEMFKSAGLKPDIRQASFGGLLPLLETNKANIALELEPNVSQAIKNGYKIVYSMADMYGDFAMTAVTVSDETIKKEPELVQKFVNALQNAEEYAHKNPDKVIEFANRKFPDLDNDIVANAINRIIASKTFPSNVLISDKAWLQAISLRKDVGDINSIEESKSVLDMSFASKAIKN